MRRILLTTLLLILTTALAAAETSARLQKINSSSTPGVAHLTLVLDKAPETDFSISGQRLNIVLSSTVVSERLAPLPEDETVVRVLLAKDRSDLVVSVLLRRVPQHVRVQKQSDRISFDLHWDGELTVRPGIAFDLKGMPVRSGSAGLQLAQGNRQSGYQGDWRDFFRRYLTPLQLQVPLQPTVTAALDSSVALTGDPTLAQLVAAGNWQAVLEQTTALGAAIGSEAGNAAAYLQAFALAASGQPYRSQVELQRLAGQIPVDHGLLPAVQLLEAELAISQQRPEPAGTRLTGLRKNFPQFAADAVRLRQADLLATADPQQATECYRQLTSAPLDLFSQARRAEAALASGDDSWAQLLFRQLAERLPDQNARRLASFGAWLASYRAGEQLLALDELQKLSDEAPETEAGLRARMAILDHWVPRLNAETAHLRILEYQLIIDQAPNRDLREEAAFKQGLGYYFNAEAESAITRLNRNLREFVHGRLTAEAEQLLCEILPPTLKGLLRAGETYAAVVLVEQNRDLLIRHRLEDQLLFDIAAAYRSFGMLERAERIYLYLVDISAHSDSRQQALLQLAESNLEAGRLGPARHYAERYRQAFPKGAQLERMLLIAALTLRNPSGPDEAAALLRDRDLSQSPELALRAADLFWTAGAYPQVEDCLRQLATRGELPPRGKLLNAENLLRLGKREQALQQYRELFADSELADQARYRVAGIELDARRRNDARALLEEISQRGTDPRWKQLAEMSLRSLDSAL